MVTGEPRIAMLVILTQHRIVRLAADKFIQNGNLLSLPIVYLTWIIHKLSRLPCRNSGDTLPISKQIGTCPQFLAICT